MHNLVIIPTYNEKDNIERLIKAVFKVLDDVNILVVDDSSPDGTAKIVQKLQAEFPEKLHLLVRKNKEGLGKAYCAGFKWALHRKYDIIVSMDADFSHDPKHLPDLIKGMDNADICIGSRYIRGGGVKGWNIERQLNSRIANIATRLMLGIKAKDTTAGYKTYSAKFLKSIDLNSLVSSGYAFQVEMLYLAKERGFKTMETPITFVDRREGQSKISGELKRSAKIVWRLFLKRKTIRQMLKFAVVGTINVGVDWGIYAVLTRGFKIPKIPSRISSSIIALCSSYILNRRWTFKSNDRNYAAEAIKFLIINGLGIIFNNLIFAFLVKKLNVFDLYALAIGTVIVFFWNFLLTKHWAFRK